MVSTSRMARPADLWRLQEIDSALDTRRASLEDALEERAESDELGAARALVEQCVEALRDAQSAQSDLDLEAQGLRDKVKPAEEKLYGGSIKNAKELADLQADVESMKRHLATIEDRDLAAIEAVETADRALQAARTEFDGLDAASREEQSYIAGRIEQLTAEIRELDPQRAQAAAAIETSVLGIYEHVRRAHQGKGVAKLDRNLCLGCRISLPVATVNRARSAGALVQCPNCERILLAI